MKDINDVKLFVFDLDGTVYIGDSEIEGSFLAIDKLRESGKKVCFFTNNSSRNHNDYVCRLNNLGLHVEDSEIYTSGEVTCEYIVQKYPNSKVFLLGNDRLKEEFERYGITLVDDNPDVCVIGFDTSLTYDKLYKFCAFVQAGLPYIATHPDYFCPAPTCPMPDIGAMIEAIYLTVNRRPDVIMGKPHTTAGEMLTKKFNLSANEIAMVGDRLYTDIKFGNNCGFLSILVLSGETDKDMLKNSSVQPDIVLNCVREINALIAK